MAIRYLPLLFLLPGVLWAQSLMELQLPGEAQPRMAEVERIGEHWVYEGDMLVMPPASAGDTASARALGLASSSYYWPNSELIYAYDDALPQVTRDLFVQAMEHWTEQTGVRFKLRSNESGYVLVMPGSSSGSCAAHVGYLGIEQNIFLGTSCGFGNVVHEIGHALGLQHEHTRADRDTFITVDESQITPGREQNFTVRPAHEATAFGAYDLGSIMHYPTHAFAVGSTPVISVNAGVDTTGITIGQRSALSAGDIYGSQLMYGVDLAVLAENPQIASGTGLTHSYVVVSQNDGRGVEKNAVLSLNYQHVSRPVLSGADASYWSCADAASDQLLCSRIATASMVDGISNRLAISYRPDSDQGAASIAVAIAGSLAELDDSDNQTVLSRPNVPVLNLQAQVDHDTAVAADPNFVWAAFSVDNLQSASLSHTVLVNGQLWASAVVSPAANGQWQVRSDDLPEPLRCATNSFCPRNLQALSFVIQSSDANSSTAIADLRFEARLKRRLLPLWELRSATDSSYLLERYWDIEAVRRAVFAGELVFNERTEQTERPSGAPLDSEQLLAWLADIDVSLDWSCFDCSGGIVNERVKNFDTSYDLETGAVTGGAIPEVFTEPTEPTVLPAALTATEESAGGAAGGVLLVLLMALRRGRRRSSAAR